MNKLVVAALFLAPVVASAQSVDLIYQGNGYVPPFYPGGSLWSQEGSVTFFAVPEGLGDPSRLDYRWIKDGTVLGSLSGVGKNTLISEDPLFGKPQNIQVQILGDNDELLARRILTIAPQAPSVLVYQDNPLFGLLFNREVSGAYPLAEQEIVLSAFPLYFSTSRREGGSVSYSWQSAAGQDSVSSIVTYRVPEGAEGSAAISVSATNPSTIHQTAEKDIKLTFGSK